MPHPRPRLLGRCLTVLTTPVIYGLVVPFALLDGAVTLYQALCFPVYGMALVPRQRYFVFDRYRLPYLDAVERLNCSYCGYANGVLAYVRAVASRTEQYWCPIKHARPLPSPHGRYRYFVDYGDARAYKRQLPAFRAALNSRHVPRRARGGFRTAPWPHVAAASR